MCDVLRHFIYSFWSVAKGAVTGHKNTSTDFHCAMFGYLSAEQVLQAGLTENSCYKSDILYYDFSELPYVVNCRGSISECGTIYGVLFLCIKQTVV